MPFFAIIVSIYEAIRVLPTFSKRNTDAGRIPSSFSTFFCAILITYLSSYRTTFSGLPKKKKSFPQLNSSEIKKFQKIFILPPFILLVEKKFPLRTPGNFQLLNSVRIKIRLSLTFRIRQQFFFRSASRLHTISRLRTRNV